MLINYETMNHSLLFLICLLTVISVINAAPHKLKKGQIEFEKCVVPGEHITPVVTVLPDHIVAGQVVDFSIYGVDSDLLAMNVPVVITFFKLDGTPIQFPSIFFTNVGIPITVKAPSILPDSYAVVVGITGPSSDQKLRNYCAVAIVGASKDFRVPLRYIDQIFNNTINPLTLGHIN